MDSMDQPEAPSTPVSNQELPVEFGPVDIDNRNGSLDELKKLNAAIFPVNYQDKFYRDCTACEGVTQLAYNDGKVIGAVACRLEAKEGGLARLYIMTLGVYAPYRGAGVGRRLLFRALEACLDDPNIVEAYLHVQTSNEDAIRFYGRFGFHVTEEIKNYYKRIEPPDCYVLTRDLR